MTALLAARGISKRYGDCVSLANVDFELRAGEIHALVGENGAGKSTLLKILYGLVTPDSGTLSIDSQPLASNVAAAQHAGLRMVQQHFALVPEMTVLESILVAQPDTPAILDLASARAQLAELGAKYGLPLAPDRRIAEMSVGERQRVELMRVLWRPGRALLLDEPTAVLGPTEVPALLGVLQKLRDAGTAIVIVTHKLGEVLAIADRMTVLRRGELAGAFDKTASINELSRAIVGGEPPIALTPSPPSKGRVRIEVANLRVGDAVQDVSFDVRAGEVFGIGGVEGNGQSALFAWLAGLVHRTSGTLRIDGNEQASARDSVAGRHRVGIAQIPEDRHRHAMLVDASLEDNVYLLHAERFSRYGFIDRSALRKATSELLKNYDVRPADPTVRIGSLSGGNQQKLVIARALLGDPSIVLFAQPSRGIDLSATHRLHEAIAALRDRGCAVLLYSADLDELCALAQRIAIFYRGRIVKLVDNPPDGDRDALRQTIGRAMVGAAS